MEREARRDRERYRDEKVKNVWRKNLENEKEYVYNDDTQGARNSVWEMGNEKIPAVGL